MSIAARIANADRMLEVSQRAHDFTSIVRYLAAYRFDPMQAAKVAESRRASPAVVQVLKAATAAGSVSGSTWGDELAVYSSAVAAFLESVGQYSAFDQLLPFMVRVPLRSNISVVTTAATGATVTEMNVKLISALALENKQITEEKAAAIVIVSNELLKLASPGTDALIGNELRKGVASATDLRFIAALVDGVAGTSSAGGTSASILADLAGALASISGSAASRYFVIAPSATVKHWAVKTTSTGALAFPSMSPRGGSIGGVDIVISDSVTSDQWLVVDASQIAAAAGTLDIGQSQHAALQLDSAPDSPPSASTSVISLFQSNQTAIRLERFFGCERLRSTAVALIDNASYSGNSPA